MALRSSFKVPTAHTAAEIRRLNLKLDCEPVSPKSFIYFAPHEGSLPLEIPSASSHW